MMAFLRKLFGKKDSGGSPTSTATTTTSGSNSNPTQTQMRENSPTNGTVVYYWSSIPSQADLRRSFNTVHNAPIGQIQDDKRPWPSEELVSRMRGASFEDRRLMRVFVAAHTQYVCEQGFYFTSGTSVEVADPAEVVQFMLCDSPPDFGRRRFTHTNIKVTNNDTLGAAAAYVGKGQRVMVINMANRNMPGGGWCSGSMAQEEDIFRRSNLHRSLRSAKYPMEEFSANVVKDATVFRGPEDSGFPLLATPFQIDVVSLPAYNGNQSGRGKQPEEFQVVHPGGTGFTQEGLVRTTCNLMALLTAAVRSSPPPDVLILGAIGCGAFANPPAEVADLFASLLPRFGGLFGTVEFAIFGALTNNVNYLQFIKRFPPGTAFPPPACDPPESLDFLIPPMVCRSGAACGNSANEMDECGVHPLYQCPHGAGCCNTSAAHRFVLGHRDISGRPTNPLPLQLDARGDPIFPAPKKLARSSSEEEKEEGGRVE